MQRPSRNETGKQHAEANRHGLLLQVRRSMDGTDVLTRTATISRGQRMVVAQSLLLRQVM
ncbi:MULTISPECIES: hypothetical protein [Pseudacidovorax]|uniref:hypothetical protein n=1 Tax=Pseudacidovorax TaxID=433923 RepID=UPI001B49E4DE|nr:MULTISPECIES: hypothetical protein [Pseudacidovorax]MBP6898229.1 hypothetical protein [Pseudacidovorax sp.]